MTRLADTILARARHALLPAALALATAAAGPVAATGPADVPLPAEPQAADAPPDIEGFRTARFGDDESAVRRAIFSDFGLAGGDLRRWRNDLEQTTVLAVEVEALLPDAGPARVSYVLGRGGGLIQVTVLWGLGGDGTVQVADLEAAAAVLIAYFAEQGYSSVSGPEPVVFVDGSNLLFYARDAEGAGFALSALPRRDPAAEGPPILRLGYAADLDNPDVFRTQAITP